MASEFLHHQLNAILDRIQLEKVIASCVRLLLIYIGTLIILFIVRRVLKQVLNRAVLRESDPVLADEVNKRYGAILQLGYQVIRVLLWGITIMITLKELGIDIAPLLASAGVVGLAVGFGAQNLVRDFVTGFFMIIENQIRVGDVVTISGTTGMVEKITLRTITLRDVTGTLHILPNGTITMVSNSSQQFSFYVFDLGVAYKEDIDSVIQLIQQVCLELNADDKFVPHMLDSGEVFGLDRFGDSAVIIKGRIKTTPGKQAVVGREFNRRIKIAFDEKRIEIPYPQHTVWLNQV